MLRINAKKVAICSIMINHTYTCSRWCLVQSWDSRASQLQSRLLMVFLISNDARFNGFSFFLFRFLPSFCGKIVNRGHARLSKHVHRLFESRVFIGQAAGRPAGLFLDRTADRRMTMIGSAPYWLAARKAVYQLCSTGSQGAKISFTGYGKIRQLLYPFDNNPLRDLTLSGKTHAYLHSFDQSAMRHFTLLKKNQCVI